MNIFEDSSEDLGTVSRSSSSGWNCSNDSHRHSCLSFASNGTLPKPEVVSELGPEEIRWFFKENGSKKWVPFIGYDSLRIEFKFREFQSLSTNKSSFDSKLTVRGGLYEIELHMMKCMPIYWNGEECKITRGIWFVVGSWQPINEEYSNIIEEEHLKMFKGEILSESESNSGENVLHSISLMNFVVEWISLSNVQMFRCSSSTKLLRTVSRAFGINKAGTKLQRGYYVDSSPNDKPLDISHVVFVIHGIGQKMDIGAITKNCRILRNRISWLKHKYPFLRHKEGREEFFPVEWRSSLILDDGTVESITAHQIRGIRQMLNSSVMDIMYYNSPLYRSEIFHGLMNELNRLYSMFIQRNHYFEANGGKVSVIAHSLGAVIMYDIVTGWNPIHLYHQYVRNTIDESVSERRKSLSCLDKIKNIDKAKENLIDLESKILAGKNFDPECSAIKFKIENFFCLGSPLAVFLALRGIRPKTTDFNEIISNKLCKRLLNIYHPTDPVAYRLEPLISKEFTSVLPVQIPKYHEALQNLMSTNENCDDVFSEDNQHRTDFVLREGSLENSYISALTSHTSYWSSYDVLLFILMHLHPLKVD